MSAKKPKRLLIKEEVILTFPEEVSLKKFNHVIVNKSKKLSKYSNIKFKIGIDREFDFHSIKLVGDRKETEEEASQREKESAATAKNANSDIKEYAQYLRLKQKFEP